MLALWQRLPVVVRALLAGATVATAGLGPWAAFSLANQKFWLSVPWAIVPTSLFLWLFWRYLRGEWWPRTTAEPRRSSLRANSLSGDVWGMAIFAGMLGFVALVPYTAVLRRLVTLNQAKPITLPPGMPFVTAFFLLVMASIVAGVVEEAAFRGYMQGPIERRHGPVVAIVLMAALFGLAHVRHHPDSVLAVMPYYLAVSAIYGGIAYLTNSILPGLVLHAGGDVFVLNRLWLTGQGEWQLTSKPPALIWESGPDAAFWGSLAALILLGAAAVWAFVALGETARTERGPRPTPAAVRA